MAGKFMFLIVAVVFGISIGAGFAATKKSATTDPNTNPNYIRPKMSETPKKIDIEKYFFQPNRNIPQKISDGEVALGTLVTPKGSFVQRMSFRKGAPVSVQKKWLPSNFRKIRLRGAEAVTIHTLPATGANGSGQQQAPLAKWTCEFDCYFGEGTCMICGHACTNGKDWVFGPQTEIDCN